MRKFVLAAVLAATVAILPAAAAQAATPWGFVTHSGSHLMTGGKPFRFSGANIEWLGLVGYGPLNFQPGQTQRFPTHYEINDALATATEMGATVVRAQTLGDTVGCGNCLEPKLGQWNPAAYRIMDYAIMRARHYGIRLILEFQGDSRSVNGGSSGAVFSSWAGGADFWSDPTVIKEFEANIGHVINHVNSYTGVAYKNDPTIFGWMDCNDCGDSGGSDAWVESIAAYIKSQDPNHLEISNAPLLIPSKSLLSDPNIDAFGNEVYPHWVPEVDGDRLTGADPIIHLAASQTAAAGKVWFASEFGWDQTDWVSAGALQSFLNGLQSDPNVSGDLFWALEGHANGHGFTPIPADSNCAPGAVDTAPPSTDVPTLGSVGCETGEDGSWWALYYTGITTASNTAADMAARAQILRAHAYAMSGLPLPPHMIPPAPVITKGPGGHLFWEGSAGAKDYSIEQSATGRGKWVTPCSQCVTDLSDGWTEPSAGACYRVVPYNLDGVAGPASAARGSGCRAARKRATHKPTTQKKPGRVADDVRKAKVVTCPAARWVGSWADSPSDSSSIIDPSLDRILTGPLQTMRMIITPHLGGSVLRIHLTNRFGSKPVTFNDVTIGSVASGAALVAGTVRTVSFAGSRSVTVPAGQDVVSDPVSLRFHAFDTLAVSLYLASDPGLPTEHFSARQTSYLTLPAAGDQSSNPSAAPFTAKTTARYYLDGLDVKAAGDAGSIVTFGDSITDGYQTSTSLVIPETASTLNTNGRWPDDLQRRLIAAGDGRLALLNEGISGNRVLQGGQLPFFGPSGLSRFKQDALDQTGVSEVILLEGANDIGQSQATAAQLEAGYRQLIAAAHAAGKRILIGTLTPMGLASGVEATYATAAANATRLAINAWIRSGASGADGFIDFDAAVRNPADPSDLLPAYNGGDGLHLDLAGYQAMANAVSLAQLRGPACTLRRRPRRRRK